MAKAGTWTWTPLLKKRRMADLLQRLRANARRGSKPRCHLLTDGPPDEVAARLTALATPFAHLSANDRWLPQGFEDIQEPELDKASSLLHSEIRTMLGKWWLAPASAQSRTPNFDIASTCAMDGKPGLLLVEAKAHNNELINEAAGRRLEADSSGDRRASHRTIGAAIASARDGLEKATSLPWRIERDSHYQMSNRFAWAWKLTALGVPVVLIYLGFLRAAEMADQGKPFGDHEDWERVVKAHSGPLFPSQVWNSRWTVNGQAFVPLIRSLEQPLPLA